jgi:hypothetical protein
MRGRARLVTDVSEIKLLFGIPKTAVSSLTGASITSPERPTPNFAASWNVAPTDPAAGRAA